MGTCQVRTARPQSAATGLGGIERLLRAHLAAAAHDELAGLGLGRQRRGRRERALGARLRRGREYVTCFLLDAAHVTLGFAEGPYQPV